MKDFIAVLILLLCCCGSADAEGISVPWMQDCNGTRVMQPSLPVVWSFDCGRSMAHAPVEFVNSVRAGFTYWNDTTAVLVFTEGPCGRGIVVHLAEPSQDGDEVHSHQGSTHDGEVWLASNMPYDYGTDLIRALVAHEAGHVLGYAHTSVSGCLMVAILPKAEGLCDAELDAFYEVYR